MSFAALTGPVRAFIIGLALLGPGVASAQKTVVKSNKIKSQTTEVTAPPVPSAPQPNSPVVSAPQVLLPAPTTMTVAAVLPEAKTAGLTGWATDLGAAQAQAKASNRPILAVFSGSDWCKPCIMYEQEVFSKPEFTEYAKGKLVLAHFDFPRQKKNQPTAAQVKLNEAAAAQLNREGDFPLAVIIAPDGKVLARTGYIAGGPTAFEAYLKKIVPNL